MEIGFSPFFRLLERTKYKEAKIGTKLKALIKKQIPSPFTAIKSPANAGPGAVAACDCVPPYPETRAYVARILGLLDGVGELVAPTLEVRLVS